MSAEDRLVNYERQRRFLNLHANGIDEPFVPMQACYVTSGCFPVNSFLGCLLFSCRCFRVNNFGFDK